METIAHTGETDREQSILETIQLLNASRIGHALGIRENSETKSVIRDRNIALDLCPTSNLATQVIQNLSDHPLKTYLERGYSVSLNSDDPGFFSTSINHEFQSATEVHSLSARQIVQLAVNSVNGSFLPNSRKQSLINEIHAIAP